MQKISNLLKTIKKQGYHDIVVDEKNKLFLDYLKDRNIDKNKLTKITLYNNWKNCFNEELLEKVIIKKLKLFTKNHIKFDIKFVNALPAINISPIDIIIHESIQNEFKEYWYEFQNTLNILMIAPDRISKNDFQINNNWSYKTILEKLPTIDESNKKRYRQKKLYYLFFLFLSSKQKALLPTQFIMSEDTFYNYTSRLTILESFKKEHFFMTRPHNSHLIEKELCVNNKAKYINYIRFSYLINYDISLLKNLTDDDITTVMHSLMNSARSSKMVTVYENPIRKCLFWHGASNISPTKKESKSLNFSPLEILNDIKSIDSRFTKIFYPYFSSRPNNQQYVKYAKQIKAFIIYLHNHLEELNVVNLRNFFKTSIKKNSNNIQLDSSFLQYLYQNIPSSTLQQEIQMIVFQSLGNFSDFSNCFLKNDLETIYKMPKNRRIARLALDKKILTKMKEICILNPIPDNYYISTHLEKEEYIWKHFDKSEPQLPVMLFLFLSMPWRKEHIISICRENFLKFDENSELIEIHVTTDKNQDNNFIIEKEFFEYAITFTDLNGVEHCPIELIKQTIEYSKKSFPTLKPTYRKENKTWGKIQAVLCRNNANGFIPEYVFVGYYYKVFLQALFELNYPYEKISYFVQLSDKGLQEILDYSNIYPCLKNISLHHSSVYFNSNYFSPHAIRKTNITYLLHNKKSLEFVIKLSGHTALSTVLSIYIDYDLLNRLNISENNITSITNHFKQKSSFEVREIIKNYQKFHSLSIENIKEKLFKENLFFAPLILSNNKTLKQNMLNTLDILEPIYWEELSTGICTNALNCIFGQEGTCSICPYFLTSSNFIESINSKIMQLSSKAIEFFNIIFKHMENENLDSKEAIIYEDEVQLTLAQLEGYSAIVDKINTLLHEEIQKSIPISIVKNLPLKKDLVLIKYEHKTHLKAQLEIYQHSKNFTNYNIQIEHSINILYIKIMELILLNEIPRDLFLDTINDKELAIDRFLELLNNNSSVVTQMIKEKYLLT